MDSGVPVRPGAMISLRFPPRVSQIPPLQARFTQPPPVLHLAGDIDEWTYPSLIEVLAAAAATGWDRIRVDLAGVGYCDVAGLRAIMSLAGGPGQAGSTNGEASAGQVVLAHLHPPLRSVLRILGWDTVPGVIVEDCPC